MNPADDIYDAASTAKSSDAKKPEIDDRDFDEFGNPVLQDYKVILGTILEDYGPQNADDFNDDEPEHIVAFWERATKETRVFARVNPLHKQIIVQAYQRWGSSNEA